MGSLVKVTLTVLFPHTYVPAEFSHCFERVISAGMSLLYSQNGG